MVYSTYLGGTGYDSARGIAVDADGNAFVTGYTSSADFPTRECEPGFRGAVDAFVTMLDPNGADLVYSTYLGGSGTDRGQAIAVDAGGTAYVVGETGPVDERKCTPCKDHVDDFPTSLRAFQRQYGGGGGDGFVVKIAEPELPLLPRVTVSGTTGPPQMAAATASVADTGQSAGSGGGGAFDWLTLSALFGATALVRRRRAKR